MIHDWGEVVTRSDSVVSSSVLILFSDLILIESEKQGVLRSRLIRPLRLEAQDTALSRR